MKKIISFVLLLLCFNIFSAMKVVYENESGKILAIGPFVNYKLNDGESILDVPDASPDDIETHIVDNENYREKSNQEKQADRDKEKQDADELKTKKQTLMQKLSLTNEEVETFRELLKEE